MKPNFHSKTDFVFVSFFVTFHIQSFTSIIRHKPLRSYKHGILRGNSEKGFKLLNKEADRTLLHLLLDKLVQSNFIRSKHI